MNKEETKRTLIEMASLWKELSINHYFKGEKESSFRYEQMAYAVMSAAEEIKIITREERNTFLSDCPVRSGKYNA